MTIKNNEIHPEEGMHLKNIHTDEIYDNWIIPAKTLSTVDFIEVSEEDYQTYIANLEAEMAKEMER